MPATSQTIIPSNTHSGMNANPIEIVGDPFKGDGYYGWGDGVHTVSYQLTNFVGNLKIQATLASSPGELDWFDIDNTMFGDSITPTTTVQIINFIGNFVWVRAIVNYTAGTVNSVLYNH
jgi:hypothetical protein